MNKFLIKRFQQDLAKLDREQLSEMYLTAARRLIEAVEKNSDDIVRLNFYLTQIGKEMIRRLER